MSTRREFLAALAGSAAMAGLGAAPARRRPNVLFFNTDDQSWADCSGYGSRRTPTASLGRARGSNAYAASASCPPSCWSMLTARNHWELPRGSMRRGPLPSADAVCPDLLERAAYHPASRRCPLDG